MSFTDIFIRRPVLATVISLVILLVGAVSYNALGVRQFPRIETSVITVNTVYPGASAKLMESFVAVPIENAIAGVEGIDYITSTNEQGNSLVKIFLKQGYDINVAINEVSDKISSIRGVLPEEVDDPVIAKQDPNARPTIFLTFNSDTKSPQQITDYLVRVIQPEIQTIDGVGEAVIFGAKRYAMRIWLDPTLMAAQGIVALDIANALQSNNLQTAAGRIETKWQEFNITAKTDLNNAQQFANLILRKDGDYIVRLRDVGQVELGAAETRSSTLINGKPTVVMGLIPKSTANPLTISQQLKEILPRLQEEMPKDLHVSITWDSSKFIAESIHEVYKTIYEATIFVIIVIFLFLGSVRAVIIPTVTIPLSLIGVCTLMLALGFTLNTLTLLAWVLAIGMVVDDAIVVLENIHRHMEAGLSGFQAALKGASEIRFAVIAMTMTLAAVYAPIGFTTGLTGSLFREFAFTLACAVIISGIVALTLSPMLSSKILRYKKNEKSLASKIDAVLERLKQRYQQLLTRVLSARKLIMFTSIPATLLICVTLWQILPSELAPIEDQGALMGLAFGPTAANLAFTEKYTQQIGKIYQSVPERAADVIINGFPAGVNSSLSFLILKPWSERQRTAMEIKQSIFPAMWSIPGLQVFPADLQPLPISGDTPVDFVLKTTASYTDLNRAVKTLMAEAQKNPGLNSLRSNLKLNKPDVSTLIDRDKAGDLGISMADISRSLNILFSETDIGRFVLNGRNYDVIPQLAPQYRDQASDLNNIYFRTGSGDLTQLANLIDVNIKVAPEKLEHFQQLRSANITANLSPGYSLGEALNFLAISSKNLLPDSIQFDYAGQSRQFIQAGNTLLFTMLMAICFIYLFLSAQFESFIDPIIILLGSVPLAFMGALITIYLSHSSLNIYTQIGLVTLIGLISKHGILMVEFANHLQHEGKDRLQAIIESAAIRLRPILMTTAAMILGALPLALATGAGAAARSQMGWVIVGGMAFGTLFTLFIVPSFYAVIAKKIQS
ncbi:MAG: efflux RND transporter permease subunit [Gammaproteobacteria bacterium]